MRTAFTTLVLAIGLAVGGTSSSAGDWISSPGKYSHDPSTGNRVSQYEQIGPVYIYPRPDFQRSGYRHIRSSLRVGGSVDNFHIVEEWGRPVRPYGEWQRPFRPYSVPYQLWGAPYAGMYQPIPWAYPYRGGRYGRGRPGSGPGRPGRPGGPIGPGRPIGPVPLPAPSPGP